MEIKYKADGSVDFSDMPYNSTIIRPDTSVMIKVSTFGEDSRERDRFDFAKFRLRYLISRLERDLEYYSDPLICCDNPQKIREDIIGDLKKLYRYRNKVYCEHEDCSSLLPRLTIY